MTMVPATLDSPQAPPPEAAERRLPKAAFAFYLVVGAAALVAAGPRLEHIADVRHGWVAFFVFATGAALAQLFVVVAPRRGRNSEGTLSYHTTGVFLLPAALLLAPPLAALAVNRWVLERDGILPNAHARTAFAGIAACVAYVLVNHGLLAAMFRLGRNISIRESGLFAG